MDTISETPRGAGPRSLVCYVCGVPHLGSSLLVHVEACENKRKQRESSLPRDERRPPLRRPPALREPLPSSQSERDVFNEIMRDAFAAHGRTACACGRSFDHDV